jgi:hypothetical protein
MKCYLLHALFSALFPSCDASDGHLKSPRQMEWHYTQPTVNPHGTTRLQGSRSRPLLWQTWWGKVTLSHGSHHVGGAERRPEGTLLSPLTRPQAASFVTLSRQRQIFKGMLPFSSLVPCVSSCLRKDTCILV